MYKRKPNNKKRGPNRQGLILGGIKKQEKTLMRKLKQWMNKAEGWLDFQPKGR